MILVLQPAIHPPTASAQADYSYLYIEPRTTIIRRPDGSAQMQGKVVIDMRNGEIWGFPTLTSAPYPVDTTKPTPPVSEPMYLGKFDFSKMVRK
jgi:hypothetical protein